MYTPIYRMIQFHIVHSIYTWLAPSQWKTSLQSNTISHWVGANLKSALLDHTLSLWNKSHIIPSWHVMILLHWVTQFNGSFWSLLLGPSQAGRELYINGLVQERLNSTGLAMALHLSCTNPSIWRSLLDNVYIYILGIIYHHLWWHKP